MSVELTEAPVAPGQEAVASPGETAALGGCPANEPAVGLAGFGGYSPSAAPFVHTPEFLLDVQLSVSVEVGRIQMSLRRLMELAPGAVIELQRAASEPVEIHANGRCIGRGEVVVVGDQFGVRITELGPA